MSGQPFAGSWPGYRIMWIGGVAVRRNRIHRLPNSRRFNLGSWLLPTLGSENGFLKVEGLPLAGEGDLDRSSLSGLFKILLHLGEKRIGVGGIKVGDEKAMGLGRDGFAEAELGGTVAPTAAVGIFFFGVLSVADE